GRSDESVEREARKDLREIAARYNPFVVDVLKRLLNFVFHRIYDGVDVDEAGMKRLVEASKKGPLILCPCHKSHIDYMILSMICDDYGLQPPHVAAGPSRWRSCSANAASTRRPARRRRRRSWCSTSAGRSRPVSMRRPRSLPPASRPPCSSATTGGR